ncbi:MAG: glucuronate isomerase [Termitinemataceae bacterium]|nr:MAG: glucuronate isomerase [Termitinemataceae bacterium]
MAKFMDKDFLLSTKTGRKLFHGAAAAEPIFDYHCHLSPQDIAENKRFDNLSEMWLSGDHYKWRAMRAAGVPEQLITGGGDPYDKFTAWAATMPYLPGNPLYHWTHLELQRYFDIFEPLNTASARGIWKKANDKIKSEDLSVHGIFKKFNVYAVGTTDDPIDDLHWHEKIAADKKTNTLVIPSFRPDRALNIDKPDFAEYIAVLGKAANMSITKLDDLLAALKDRVVFFDNHGCRASDHDLEFVPFAAAVNGNTCAAWEAESASIFSKVLSGGKPDKTETECFKTFILCFLAGEYCNLGWAMQLHIAALRAVNRSKLRQLGPNTGYDVIHDHPVAAKLSALLNTMEERGKLPKTILYSLNPADYYPMATIMGSFQAENMPGKMQLGSAWWFLDNKDGMEAQMRLLANEGLLSRFVGMLTDSRSFLSYPRHEYFRRILCNIVGTWADNGEVPSDFDLLSGMVKDISFGNARSYFEKHTNGETLEKIC